MLRLTMQGKKENAQPGHSQHLAFGKSHYKANIGKDTASHAKSHSQVKKKRVWAGLYSHIIGIGSNVPTIG